MSTSPLKYRLQIASPAPLDVTQPLGAFEVRNWLLNDLCHYADGFGQQIAGWSGIDPALSGTADGEAYMTPEGTWTPTGALVEGVPYLIAQWSCPLRIRANANSYRVRLRIAGASSSNGDSVCFFAALGLPGRFCIAPLQDGTDWLWGVRGPNGDAAYKTEAIQSTTPAWLAGESLGTNEWETMIALNPDQVAAQLNDHGGTALVYGGDAATVKYLDTTLLIFGMQIDAPAIPRLYAVSACEWIGV